jgi:hypothetical protein
MITYAFYWLEEVDKVHFIGLLSERRKDSERITQESISNFVRTILGNKADIDNLFFIEITLDEGTGQILWPERSLRLTQAQA